MKLSINLSILFLLACFASGCGPTQAEIKAKEEEKRRKAQETAKLHYDLCMMECEVPPGSDCRVASWGPVCFFDKAEVGYGDKNRVIVEFRKMYGDGLSNSTKAANKHCAKFNKTANLYQQKQLSEKDFQIIYTCN